MFSAFLSKKLKESIEDELLAMSKDEREIREYNIDNYLMNVDKVIYIIISAMLYGIYMDVGVIRPLIQIVFMMILFYALRKSAYGIHINGWMPCMTAGFTMYVGGLYLSGNIHIPYWAVTAIFVFSFVCFSKYAPKSTANQPLPRSALKRLKQKTLVLTGALYFVSIILNAIGMSLYANMIAICTIYQVFCILPITYKIFRIKERYI